MDQFEKFENQLLSSYESTLAEESRKICKELEILFKDDEKFNDNKITNYCSNILILGKDVFDINKAQERKILLIRIYLINVNNLIMILVILYLSKTM